MSTIHWACYKSNLPVNNDSWANVDSGTVMSAQPSYSWAIRMANDDRPTQSALVLCVGWLELALRWCRAAQPTSAYLVDNLSLNADATCLFLPVLIGFVKISQITFIIWPDIRPWQIWNCECHLYRIYILLTCECSWHYLFLCQCSNAKHYC